MLRKFCQRTLYAVDAGKITDNLRVAAICCSEAVDHLPE